MNILILILVISLGIAASILTKKLTAGGAITGGILSPVIFFGVNWQAIVLMAAFFVMGTVATSLGRRTKEGLGIAQEVKGRRNTGQVLANGGAAGLLGVAAILLPQHRDIIMAMIAATFSSATADTLSSELGSVYGKNFYDIISFRKGVRGADGVVSIEGFLSGICGSVIIAAIYAAFTEWNYLFYFIVIAGFIGNVADSVLGATLERRNIIKNNAVNFLNTVIAALAMLLMIL